MPANTLAKKLQSGNVIKIDNHHFTVLAVEPFGYNKRMVRVTVITADETVFQLFLNKYKDITLIK